MKRKQRGRDESASKRAIGKGAIDVAEEAFFALRTAPPGILARYYVGTLPFVLAFLYFWADMAHSAFAYGRLAAASLGLAILFVWMKAWQSFFARRLREHVGGEPPARRPLGQGLQIAVRQAWIHCTGLLVLPAAAFLVAPFGWVYALYQNATVLDGGEMGTRELFRAAGVQAGLWQRQNHMLVWFLSPFLVVFVAGVFLLILPIMEFSAPIWSVAVLGQFSAFLAVILLPLCPFGMLVAVNIGTLLYAIPELLRMLLGVETVFTISAGAMVNPTFFMIVCSLTYLCLDPLMKTAYVLRCYYGEALHNGEDLLADLRLLRRAAAALLVLAAVFLAAMGFADSVAWAESTDAAAQSAGLPAELNEALDGVLKDRVYAWRIPRVRPEESDGLIVTFMKEAVKGVARGWRAVRDWMGRVADWIGRLFPGGGPRDAPDLSVAGNVLRVSTYLLVGALVVVLVYFFWKTWRVGKQGAVAAEVVATAAPDLAEEGTTADELPESGWLDLGRDLMARGELRLAMRAFFFSGLARLAYAELISVARHKSNRDYARELGRVSHEDEALPETFRQGVGVFESVWYGTHEVTPEGLSAFVETQERLRPAGLRS